MLPAAGDAAASSVGFCSCFSVENGGSYDDYIDGSGNRGCMHCKRSDPSSSSSCYSCSSLWLDLAPFKDSEKLQRVITASAKGFSIGAGLKGGLALFSILTRLRRRQSSAFSRKIEDFSNKEAITMAIKETIRYGLFLGTFAGTFVSVDEIIGALGGHRSEMEGFISGVDSRAFHAAHRTKHAAYEFGNLHTDAGCSLGIAVWDK